MTIGYSVEGATDRAFLNGLHQRWCPDAHLIEGAFRGSSGKSLRRDIPRICRELDHKGADIIVFLTDANDQNWREVRTRESNLIPLAFRDRALYGVADRNIECWLAADPDYLARCLGISPQELRVPDPKSAFERAMGITSNDRKEDEIASVVAQAPLRNWLRAVSFEAFYEDAWQLSRQYGQLIPNER